MRPSKIIEEFSNIGENEEAICIWFTKEDFPIGVNNDGEFHTISTSDWNDVVSRFENTKWDNPMTSSWTEVHKEVYRIVGDKLNAGV
jgi:hypothetical protein